MRVVVANEPNVYREVISRVLRELRPQAEVLAVEPAQLDAALLGRPVPDLVVCSSLTPAVQASASSWVELYPDGGPGAVVSLRGERAALAEMTFDVLLGVLDRVAAGEEGLSGEAGDLSRKG